MILAKIRVNGVQALPVDVKHIPKGIIGGQIAFEYTDHMWDGLTKTVVFQGAVTKDVVNAGDLVTIPPEVVQRAAPSLHVGVYGTDAENNIAIPTLWADLGRIRAAADPSGDESTDESLPVWAQLQEQIDDLKENGTGSVDESVIREMVEDYLQENPPTAGKDGRDGLDGEDGGYYTPAVTQPDSNTLQFDFTPSKADMPAVEPVQIPIPSSGGNVDLTGVVKSVNGQTPDDNGNVQIETNAPTDEQVADAVGDYLAEHPEATTTVQDGSITEEKLNDSVKRRIRRPNCKIIAHRGYWATAHQNTVAAFLEAIENGFDWLEIDIRTTADGVYVLAHDNGYTMYNNGTAVTGAFTTSNYADIKDYTWDAAGVYKLNTLLSAFAALKMHDVTIICDRKAGTNESILTLSALCGVSDKIMLSYGSPTAALAEKTLLNRYKHIPIRVGVTTYNEMLSLLDGISNPVYADTNASTAASYQQKAQICLACHIPMIYAGCTMNRTERWAVLANGAMASTNVSYADMCTAIDIDYDAVATITAKDSVTVAVGGTSTLEATSDLNTNAGYVYGYSVNPNVATVQQTVFGSAATIVVAGVAAGSTTIRLFTGCGAILDIPCTVSNGAVEPDEPSEPDAKTYTITNNLTNVSTSNSAASIAENTAYTAILTAPSGHEMGNVTVTMGGVDITATAYSGGVVTIASVTGNVVITATATAASGFQPVTLESADFIYTFGASPNNTCGLTGHNSRGVLSSAYEQELAYTPATTGSAMGLVLYPIPIPAGATSATVNCTGYKWNGYVYSSTGSNLKSLGSAVSGKAQSVAYNGAAYLGVRLEADSLTPSADTDISAFTLVFS